jgi:hypothetical protein
MGGGSWSSDFYRHREAERVRSGGVTFAYDAANATKSHTERHVHADLSPNGVAFRESRDSDEHPETNPVAVFFDITGSMRDIPKVLQQKLPSLMDTLNSSGYLKGPQVFFGAVGDATCDRGSLQVGQFESDNRVNAAFEKMWLEGGGGGSCEESYQNAMYFAARHMELDCLSKRKKKGYLFLIGDEMAYRRVSAREINTLMGANTLQDDIPIESLMAELREKFHVYMIIPTTASHGNDPRVQNFWRNLLGQNVILSDDIEHICEVIAMAVGLNEGVSLEQMGKDLQGHGSTETSVTRASRALTALTADRSDAPRHLRL